MNKTFLAKAPGFLDRLVKEYGLKDFQAAGIVGNFGHESAGFTILHEIGQPAGRGGYGWGQWTGPRRQSFLQWCMTHHLDWRGDAGNISYAIYELDGAYHSVVVALGRTHTVEEASDLFEQLYERAGVPALEARREWSRAALSAYRSRGQ
jgi:hypothetical protein